MPDDAAQRFGRSAPLDAAAAERAGLRGEKSEGIACPPPWWLPPFMANHGQAHSGNQAAHVDVDDGKPRCDLMSQQSVGQRQLPKPADSPSHALPSSESSRPVRSPTSIAKGRETINSWTSSTALLCAFVFVVSVYAFNAKVPTTPFLLRAACTLLPPHFAPCTLPSTAPRAAPAHPQLRVPHCVRGQIRMRKKGAQVLNCKARSPEVHNTRANPSCAKASLVVAFLLTCKASRPAHFILHRRCSSRSQERGARPWSTLLRR